MGFLNKILGTKEESKEEADYKATLAEVLNHRNGLIAMENKVVKDFFGKLFEVAGQSLHGVLFLTPENFGFKKALTKEEIDFWFRRVSLALIAYSYCFFYVEEQALSAQSSFVTFWQSMLDSYNRIFNVNATVDAVKHYAAGMIEGGEKKSSKPYNEEEVLRLMIKDYTTLATELLEEIWHENISQKALDELRNYKPGQNMGALDVTAQKIGLLGSGIWETHLDIVKPFLPKLLTDYQV